jgi:hypothetical protein
MRVDAWPTTHTSDERLWVALGDRRPFASEPIRGVDGRESFTKRA